MADVACRLVHRRTETVRTLAEAGLE